MVKVLLFQLFDNQKVVPLTEEPVDVASTPDSFFVVTKEGLVKSYSAGSEPILLHQFKTISPLIKAVHYLPATDTVITIEQDRDTPSFQFARLYHNWRYGTPTQTPTPADSASSYLLSNSTGKKGVSLRCTYLNLPMPTSITTIAACPVTNRFVVATPTEVTLWACYSLTLNSSLCVERILEIDVLRNVCQLALFNDYLAYSSPSEVKVLKLDILHNKSNDLIPITSELDHEPTTPTKNPEPFGIIEDEHLLECVFDDSTGQPLNPGLNLQVPSIKHQGASSSSTFEVLAPSSDIAYGVRVNLEAGYKLKTSTVIVHRQFPPHAGLHTLSLLPEYSQLSLMSETSIPTVSPRNNQSSLLAKSTPEISGMRCFICTSREGFLYDVDSQHPRLLTTYTFSGETLASAVSSSFLYTLSSSGLEVWTLRTCVAAGEDFPPPCLIGMQSLLFPYRICVANDNVILLSKFAEKPQPPPRALTGKGASKSNLLTKESGYTSSSQSPSAEGNTGWSLYIFYPRSILVVYEEMIGRAANYEDRDLSIYFQLALEGHFLLLGRLASIQSAFINPARTTFIPERRDFPPGSPGVDYEMPLMGDDIDHARLITLKLEAQNYYKFLKKSSTLIADYYFRNKRYGRASLFYAESDRPLSYVIQLLMPLVNTSKSSEARKAATLYFDKVLFDQRMLEQMDETPQLANDILRHYQKYAPPKLASVILDGCLSTYDQKLAVELLEDLEPGKKNSSLTSSTSSLSSVDSIPSYYLLAPKNVFVKSLLYLDLNRVVQAVTDLLSLEAEILVEFCVSNSKLIYNETEGNSDESELTVDFDDELFLQEHPEIVPSLSQVLLRFSPWTLLEILLRLKSKIPIKRAIGMLTRTTVETLKRPATEVELEYSIILECFLETVISEKRCDNSILPSILTNKLASLYLHHIKYNGGDYQNTSLPALPEVLRNFNEQYVHFYAQEWKVKHRTFFFNNSRVHWLDDLPPFNRKTDPKPSASNKLWNHPHFYVEKLQALLCSDRPRDDSAILQLLMGTNDYPGKLSFLLLVMPNLSKVEEAIKMLVEPHPSVALDYGKSYCTEPKHWSAMLDHLLEARSRKPELTSVYENVYESILEYLTEKYDPASFLRLLPADGDIAFFLPFIERCLLRNKANTLRCTIASVLSDGNL